jgi:SAM-dependent methyltransferase
MATTTHETDVMADLANDALGDAGLERLVLSGARSAGDLRRVEIRPVLLRGQRMLTVVRYDDSKSLTSNVESPTDPMIADLLPRFRHLTAQTSSERTEARVTKRGKTLVTVTAEGKAPDLSHDRQKQTMIPEDAPFLELLGLSSGHAIKPTQQGKWRQVNEFLRLLTSLPPFERLRAEPALRVVDMGSGNAYLTFATYHYLTEVLGLGCEMVGVDRDAGAVERATSRAAALGWDGLSFRHASIADVDLPWVPQLVISLHACDTGSDDAAARALTWGSEALLLAPCCHHDLQRQLKTGARTGSSAALLGPAVLRERLGDVLTDALRTSFVASRGYRTDVVQFVSPEHTAKNLMIRAWQDPTADRDRHRREYEELRDEWQVEPYLEVLLRRPPTSAGQ